MLVLYSFCLRYKKINVHVRIKNKLVFLKEVRGSIPSECTVSCVIEINIANHDHEFTIL